MGFSVQLPFGLEPREGIVGDMKRFSALLISFAFLGLAACGGGSSNYMIPTQSPIIKFEKPERADLLNEEEPEEEEVIEDVGEEVVEEPAAPAEGSAPSDSK